MTAEGTSSINKKKLTPQSGVLPEELTLSQPIKKFPLTQNTRIHGGFLVSSQLDLFFMHIDNSLPFMPS
jgi:hypothetical protein